MESTAAELRLRVGKSGYGLRWERINVDDSNSQAVLHEISCSSNLQVRVDGSKTI